MSEHMLHEYEMCFVRTNVTYENVKCSNIYYTRICVLSELKLYTKCDVRTYVSNKNVMPCVRFYVTYETV